MKNRIVRPRAELEPIRKQILSIIETNPKISCAELSKQYGVSHSTVFHWKQVKLGTLPKKTKGSRSTGKTKMAIFNHIIQNAPDTASLGVILVEGFLRKIEDRDGRILELESEKQSLKTELQYARSELETITKDKLRVEKIYAELNNKVLSTQRLQHLTIDQVQHRIINKLDA